MNATNLLAYAAQLTVIVLACAGLPRLLGLRSPGVQYAFWRTLLVLCVLLPIVEPWRPGEMVFVAAGGPAPITVPGSPTAFVPAAVAPPSRSFDWVAAAQLVILVGIGARLVWIALGMVRLRRMRRRAVESATGFEDLRDAIGAAAPILWSPEVGHPVTFGLLKPVVLLPISLKGADPAAQRAVVAHELHHVKRHDWGWVIAEELVRSAFWFHPAMWWLVSRVQLARETVVDELSILATNARRTYLDTLLAFADDTGLASMPAFSARRHLFHRIMLLSKEGEMSSIRVAFASCVLVMALSGGAWGAVTAFPLYSSEQDQKPPRDPLSPEANHRVAMEYWQKANNDTTLTPEQKLDAIQKGIAADDRALAINPDYVPALSYKNIFLRMQAYMTDSADEKARLMRQADELRDKVIALRGPAPAGSPMAGMLTANAAAVMTEEYRLRVEQFNPVRVGGNVKTPAKTRDVKPIYPPIAQTANVQGVVIIEALIDGDGEIADARILRSIPLLDAAALSAVKQWKFAPTVVDGVARAVMMTVTVNFTQQ